MLHYFRVSALLTVAAVLAAGLALGLPAAVTVIVLIAIEIAFSFDNAVINAKVLERLSPVWQRLFLTLGMVVAILGMRVVFPILIVMVTAGLPWHEVVNEALHRPALYGRHLTAAHPAIAAFGGGFLLTLALYFFFDEERTVLWLERFERPLQRLGGRVWLPPLIVALLVGLLSLLAGTHGGSVLRAGLLGAAAYALLKLAVDGLGRLAPAPGETSDEVREQAYAAAPPRRAAPAVYTGWAALLGFLYLQVLDASFSFDGVLGAFAITNRVLLIALGLGVGAIWVRSLTVVLVRRGTLKAYRYLEHGAHYAILVLAAALFVSLFVSVPDVITGIVGLGVIAASFVASRQARTAT